MLQPLQSHEQRNLLLWGESIRENPRTILLSIPIFLFGIFYYTLIKDDKGLAGSYGHLGIAFKNYHKHYWQQPFLLQIAYKLIDNASHKSQGEGLVSTILHCGQVAKDLQNYSLAEVKFKQALFQAHKLKQYVQLGYILSHLASVHVAQQRFDVAFRELNQSLKILQSGIKQKPTSLYYQIWLSHGELTMSEYYLAIRDYKQAKKYAQQALNRSQKHQLKFRQQEAHQLLNRIIETESQLMNLPS